MENRENIIINGIFVKILYSSEHFTMNGIYLDLPIVYYDKNNYSYQRKIECLPQKNLFTHLKNSSADHSEFFNDVKSKHPDVTNSSVFQNMKTQNEKNLLCFDVEKNSELISQFSKLENAILKFYVKNKNIQNKNIVNNIGTQLKNGIIKYYNYKFSNGLHCCKDNECNLQKNITKKCNNECISQIKNGMNKLYIKISGIWETKQEIGITYKIIYY